MRKEKVTAGFVLTRRKFIQGLLSIGIVPAALLGSQNVNSQELISNDELILAVLGMLQPTNAQDIYNFLMDVIAHAQNNSCKIDIDTLGLSFASIETTLASFTLAQKNYVITVGSVGDSKKSLIYSMTLAGNNFLSRSMRGLRDQVRLFLLKGPRQESPQRNKINQRGGCNSMGGDSLSLLKKFILDTSKPAQSDKLKAQAYYVESHTSALHLPRHFQERYLSFSSYQQIQQAGGVDLKGELNGNGIALCIGISGQILKWISRTVDLELDKINLQSAQAPQELRYSSKHYNRFYLPKSNAKYNLIGPRKGADNINKKRRLIESPRIFLKVIQRFILDFLLLNESFRESDNTAKQHPKSPSQWQWQSGLQVHPAVHSYVANKGIRTNAELHKGKSYIAKLDIEDFFGSINRARIQRLYRRLGFTSETASLLATLCTILDPSIKDQSGNSKSRLPQGAPTSPYLSNLVLYDFDKKFASICKRKEMGVDYSRYADDITISGNSRDKVNAAFLIARKILLDPYRFQINYKKCCFISSARQQRVTGIIVNNKVLPPRLYRRRLRALFHKANKDPTAYVDKFAAMRGHLGYLKSFPDYPAAEIVKYQAVLDRVQAMV